MSRPAITDDEIRVLLALRAAGVPPRSLADRIRGRFRAIAQHPARQRRARVTVFRRTTPHGAVAAGAVAAIIGLASALPVAGPVDVTGIAPSVGRAAWTLPNGALLTDAEDDLAAGDDEADDEDDDGDGDDEDGAIDELEVDDLGDAIDDDGVVELDDEDGPDEGPGIAGDGEDDDGGHQDAEDD